MTPGSLFDPEPAAGASSAHEGPRPFLSGVQIVGLRVLLGVYVLTGLLMLATNVRSVGNAVFRLSAMHLGVRLAIGLMGAATLFTFFLLLGMSLHHYFRGHVGPKPKALWLWVIVILNVAGVVLYYLRFIEPEQRALLDRDRVGG
jgi:hypothetical protein